MNSRSRKIIKRWVSDIVLSGREFNFMGCTFKNYINPSTVELDELSQTVIKRIKILFSMKMSIPVNLCRDISDNYNELVELGWSETDTNDFLQIFGIPEKMCLWVLYEHHVRGIAVTWKYFRGNCFYKNRFNPYRSIRYGWLKRAMAHIGWVLYVLRTMDERHFYKVSLRENRFCYGYDRPGRKKYLFKEEKPRRLYMTRKEYLIRPFMKTEL